MRQGFTDQSPINLESSKTWHSESVPGSMRPVVAGNHNQNSGSSASVITNPRTNNQPFQPSYNSLWPTRAVQGAGRMFRQAMGGISNTASKIFSGMGLRGRESAIPSPKPVVPPANYISSRVRVDRKKKKFDDWNF